LAKRNQLKKPFTYILCKAAFAALLFFHQNLFAKTIDLSWAAERKKTVISGTLNPASLSVNGQEITQTPESYAGILINDNSATITEVSGLKTFYEVIEGDQISLKWLLPNSFSKDIIKVSYPSIKEMKFSDNNFILYLNELTRKVRYDGKDFAIANPVVIPVDNTEIWLSEPHTLELTSDKNATLIYNLNFGAVKDQMLTQTSWNLYAGDPPFSGNKKPTMIGVGSRILNEKNFSRELFAGYAKTSYPTGGPGFSNDVTQSSFLLDGRWGYNPFKTNFGDFNVKRVTLGLNVSLINYQRESQFPTGGMDGYNELKVDTWYWQGGYFFRWEPLQYKDFGFLLQINFRVFRSQNSISGDDGGHFFGLAYYF
jgi:hypothetical protein